MMRSTTTQETQQLPPVPSAEAYLPSNGLQALQASISVAILRALLAAKIPDISIELSKEEAQDEIDAPVAESNNINDDSMSITCYDPCTMQSLGSMPAMTAAEVVQRVNRAKAAQQVWANSSFSQRKMFLRILQKYILNNQRTICRVAARDSGKPLVDAAFGEVLVTCEKISWLLTHGERLLQTEYRPPGNMLFYKTARVEYLPLGVVGAIVPWNYPFHNVFNPMLAAVFAGNGIVIKVSEHASWSAKFFQKVIDAALEAAGAPPGLVSLVTGFGDAGAALVTAGIAKMTFVGSTEVGRRVMAAASTTLTPVVLELGGKDPFIVCDDANMKQVVPTALRAAFQSCGQNCVAAERFLVHEAVYKQFADAVAEVARGMRQGPVLQPDVTMDCGAMCMAGSPERVQELVDDAVAKGASLLAGGCLPAAGSQPGQYYPPTVLANVTPQMRIWQEETFGPVLVVAPWKTDEEAVALANDCPYGLGSSVWSEDRTRANAIARQLQAGMAVVNDFASNYMCQSLPFGGVKDSGFDRFAGVEGLRGMCVAKAVCEDRFPALMRTEIPPPLQYPVSDVGFTFVAALCRLFYGLDLRTRLLGLRSLITCFVAPQLARSKKDA